MEPLTRLDTAERHHPASAELTKECFVRLACATHGSDLAESVSEVLNRCRSDPTDGGFSACALAFSTLLSSQGADAHHRLAFALLRGNPSNLPARPRAVKACDQVFLTELGSSRPCNVRSAQLTAFRDHPCLSYPCNRGLGVCLAAGQSGDHQLTTTTFRPCRPPGPSASGAPVSLGAGRTLSSKAVSVKSEPAPSGSPPATCTGRISLTARPPAGHPEKLSGHPWTPCSEVCNRRVAGKIPRRMENLRRLSPIGHAADSGRPSRAPSRAGHQPGRTGTPGGESARAGQSL